MADAVPPNHDTVNADTRHNTNFEEGNLMSQLTVSRDTMANAIDLAASASTVPFDFIAELERVHLTAVAQQAGSSDPRRVHALEKGWTLAKVNMATTFARAHNTLVAILHEAPAGTFASVEATASEILWNACSADIERMLLETTQRTKGTLKPSHVLDLVLAEVKHRVEMAEIIAKGQVELASIQAATPRTPSHGYTPCWGEVTGVKTFGAFIHLNSGETGLLHVSEMAGLNDGRSVKDAAQLVNVGQSLFVRVAGRSPEGKLSLALAKEAGR